MELRSGRTREELSCGLNWRESKNRGMENVAPVDEQRVLAGHYDPSAYSWGQKTRRVPEKGDGGSGIDGTGDLGQKGCRDR